MASGLESLFEGEGRPDLAGDFGAIGQDGAVAGDVGDTVHNHHRPVNGDGCRSGWEYAAKLAQAFFVGHTGGRFHTIDERIMGKVQSYSRARGAEVGAGMRVGGIGPRRGGMPVHF